MESATKDFYEILNPDEDKPFKIRLKNCAWEGIIYSYKSVEPTDKNKDGTVRCKFDYHVLDVSEDFDLEDFKTTVQLNEFENLLGKILQDIFSDLEK